MPAWHLLAWHLPAAGRGAALSLLACAGRSAVAGWRAATARARACRALAAARAAWREVARCVRRRPGRRPAAGGGRVRCPAVQHCVSTAVASASNSSTAALCRRRKRHARGCRHAAARRSNECGAAECSVVAELRAKGLERVAGCACNVSDTAQLAAMVEQARAFFGAKGRIDIVVLNAGVNNPVRARSSLRLAVLRQPRDGTRVGPPARVSFPPFLFFLPPARR